MQENITFEGLSGLQEDLTKMAENMKSALIAGAEIASSLSVISEQLLTRISQSFSIFSEQVSSFLPILAASMQQSLSAMAEQMAVEIPRVLEDCQFQLSENTYKILQTVFEGPLFENEEPLIEFQPFYEPIRKKRYLTGSQLYKLFSLLIALLPFIIGFLPDAQLERQIEQNEIIIDQSEKKLQETEKLTKAVEDLCDAIQSLSDELQNNGLLLDDTVDSKKTNGQ